MENIKYIQWTRKTERFSNGFKGIVGKFIVFNIDWDGMSSKEQKEKWELRCFLPGIKDKIGNFEIEEAAKDKAEFVMAYWLKNSGLLEIQRPVLKRRKNEK